MAEEVASGLNQDSSTMMPAGEYDVELIINSNYKFIDIAHDLVKYLCGLIGFDEDTTHWIILAVREGVSNAIKHGNECDMQKKVFVHLSFDETHFSITIEDEGRGFDPSKVKNPLAPENLLKPTGRGIFYIKNFMDEVRYEFKPSGGTILMMRKALAKKE